MLDYTFNNVFGSSPGYSLLDDGATVLSSSGNSIKSHCFSTNQSTLHQLEAYKEITAFHLSYDENMVAVGGLLASDNGLINNGLSIWDANAWTAISTLQVEFSAEKLHFSAGDATLLIIGTDKNEEDEATIALWDVQSFSLLAQDTFASPVTQVIHSQITFFMTPLEIQI